MAYNYNAYMQSPRYQPQMLSSYGYGLPQYRRGGFLKKIGSGIGAAWDATKQSVRDTGDWIADNKQGVLGGAALLGGALLTATGVGAPLGVGLMASGVGMIGNEIAGDQQAKLAEKQVLAQQEFQQGLIDQQKSLYDQQQQFALDQQKILEEKQAKELAEQQNIMRIDSLKQNRLANQGPALGLANGGMLNSYKCGGSMNYACGGKMYAKGGNIDPNTGKVSTKRFTDRQVYIPYTIPGFNQKVYPVVPSDINKANPNVFKINDTMYGTYLPYREGTSNHMNIQYLPSSIRHYTDENRRILSAPGGYEGYKYASGGGLSRSDDYGSKSKPYPSVKSSDFAGGGRSYPIPTKADAVDALRLAGLHGREDVKAKVYAKYPELKKANGGYVFANGGSIHINPENKGKFTATKNRTGKSTEELTHSKNPLTRKRAIFAQNAAKWHHANGGYMEETRYNPNVTYYANGGTHESNPMGGINLGNNGSVEQGETRYKNFIFSNRF